MFHCRKKELAVLNQRYQGNQFECMVVYGRRRVGKTALINEFCKDKPVIFFSALNASLTENLESLSRAVYLYQNPEDNMINAPVYSSFDSILQKITQLSNQKRLIFVIDEYPYLAKADPSISSKLQHIIDHVWQNGQLFLILCGSSMSFMENQVLGYQSPLYGRRTGQIKLKALNYREVAEFCPNLNPEQLSLLYGITGGIPHYINKLNVTNSIDEALISNFFDTASYLFEEPENLLKQELREPALYNSIITAIAGGASRCNEIATKIGVEINFCAKYLKVLLDLGIIQKETPITEPKNKKPLYSIGDPFFRFWYRFIPGNMATISTGRFEKVYDKAVKPYLHDYMGLIFEQICRQYLLQYDDSLPTVLSDVGQWWGTDKQLRKEVQIDIVGVPIEGNSYLIGSCKYRNDKIGIDELELIKHYATVFGKGKENYYYIFSLGGFTENLLTLEQQGKVKLLTLDNLYP
ncbi:MAG: ATP-binding protein [Oscillospiraceae bacterium]|nr:ATP-binding protein [Oscillospiraceae bacterium]